MTNQPNELLQELAELDGRVKQLEQNAVEHEAAARKARADREAAKLRASEIRRAINDAAFVHAAQGSLAAATAAQAEAQAAAARIKAKEAELDALLAKARDISPST